MKTMRIVADVTKYDIVEGAPCQPRLCPLAKALGRSIGKQPLDDNYVSVGSTFIRVTKDGKKLTAVHTKKSAAFVYAVDERRDVQPCRFTFTFEEDGS